MEQWRQIILDGEKYGYEVSDLGNVRNAKTKKILKQRDNGHGYLFVDLWKNGDGKQMYIHRLVCLMFVENDDPEHKIQVNHINEDKSNNTVENLEWCTASYNTNYGTRNERVAEKLKDREFSEETRNKISEKAKGRKVSDKARAKASETCKARIGEKHPMYGKHQSEEAKRKMSDNSTSKRQVVQTTLDGEFIKTWNSITEVTKTLGIDGSSISKVCRGKSSYAKGYKWYYLEDYKSLINE